MFSAAWCDGAAGSKWRRDGDEAVHETRTRQQLQTIHARCRKHDSSQHRRGTAGPRYASIPPPRNCVGFTNQASSKTNMITVPWNQKAAERLKYLKIHDVRCAAQQMWELWILMLFSDTLCCLTTFFYDCPCETKHYCMKFNAFRCISNNDPTCRLVGFNICQW